MQVESLDREDVLLGWHLPCGLQLLWDIDVAFDYFGYSLFSHKWLLSVVPLLNLVLLRLPSLVGCVCCVPIPPMLCTPHSFSTPSTSRLRLPTGELPLILFFLELGLVGLRVLLPLLRRRIDIDNNVILLVVQHYSFITKISQQQIDTG